MKIENKKIIIYTDGAAKGNPGRAGWGVVFIFGKEIFEIGGRSEHATNNQMELTAPIEALKYIKKHKIDASVEFFSDSKYVILGITERTSLLQALQKVSQWNLKIKSKLHARQNFLFNLLRIFIWSAFALFCFCKFIFCSVDGRVSISVYFIFLNIIKKQVGNYSFSLCSDFFTWYFAI